MGPFYGLLILQALSLIPNVLFLLFVATMALPFAEATQAAYERQDVQALRSLYDRADSVADSLLVRYRLYPLTEDESVLEGIPPSLDGGSGQELALLSALWAYRAGEGSWLNLLRCGRRSSKLLDEAKEADADNPFVLLVEGQSLLFRPAIAGRDPEAASQRFSQLVRLTDEHPETGISTVEAEIWLWLALREAGQQHQAQALRARLRSQSISALYQQFLDEPPEV